VEDHLVAIAPVISVVIPVTTSPLSSGGERERAAGGNQLALAGQSRSEPCDRRGTDWVTHG
jgi:hypothetical protein